MSALALLAMGLLLLVLLVLSAFFSMAESAIFSLNAVQVQRLRERSPKGGPLVTELLQTPTRLLSTVLVGNTLTNVASASVGYAIVERLLPTYSTVVAIPVMTLLLLILGEVAPKRLALAYAERLAIPCAANLVVWGKVLAPFRAMLEALTHGLRALLRPERRTLSDAELLTAVELGAEMGILDEEERSMVDGIMRLSEMQAREVMTPRVDLIGINLDDPPDRHLALARSMHFHFLPVYRQTPDAIEGFLDVPRFLLDPAHDLRRATQAALFVPETVALDDLLITLQRSGRPVACVLDEYGGTAGLVTRGDILELITGEILHGAENARPTMEAVDATHWLIDGNTSLDDINHSLDLELEADGAERMAGWVLAHAGRFLRPGEAVEAQDCRVEVRRVRKHRIEQVQLELLRPATDPESGNPANADFEELAT